ncbi:hypothetical protein [Micromonospora sp. WMMD980]|uniref:hypothetical protein n=1 Tax=Micromonospora sp. WMMD980 TaxID=3016088 RepID=UPI0024175A6A|nr:hypothetical protein [Micromonospora sp. WMMD980]MDG4801744.1 hypothetical protein [Micromonospora sp. WMMD980]
MERKPYLVAVSGEDVAESTFLLTAAEADAFAFVAATLAEVHNRPGTPLLSIEEAA